MCITRLYVSYLSVWWMGFYLWSMYVIELMRVLSLELIIVCDRINPACLHDEMCFCWCDDSIITSARAHWHVMWLVSYDHRCIRSVARSWWVLVLQVRGRTRRTRVSFLASGQYWTPRCPVTNHRDARARPFCFVGVYRRVCGRHSGQLHLWGPAGHLDLQRI